MKSYYRKNFRELSPKRLINRYSLNQSRSNSFIKSPLRSKTPSSLIANPINRSHSFSVSKSPHRTPKYDREIQERSLASKSSSKRKRKLNPISVTAAKFTHKNEEKESANITPKVSYPVPYQQLHSKLEKIQISSYDDSEFNVSSDFKSFSSESVSTKNHNPI